MFFFFLLISLPSSVFQWPNHIIRLEVCLVSDVLCFFQLLLHHVIPGAFEVSSLQDEMTGVSLAGTQLRVNTYSTQDVEWNDLQVQYNCIDE